jgi:hypothetical protein
MNGKEKTKYLLQYHRANRKFEAKHLPRVEKALKGVVRSLIGDIREKGIWSAMTNLSTQLWSDELTNPLLGLYKEVGLFHAKTTYRTIKSEIGQKQLGRSEQWVQDVIRILRETLLQFAVVGTSETLRNHLLLVLQQGVDKGLSVDEMVKMLEGSDFTEMQARRIIRTEVGRAANTGVKVAADSFNVEMQKEWFAFRDQRTRGVKPKDKKDHYHMDGQVVDYNADFVDPRSGERIEFPQAPGGSAAMVINCRCTWAAIPKRDSRGLVISQGGNRNRQVFENIGRENVANQSFVNAKTIAEAQDWAKENLKTKIASYKGVDLDVANTINKTLFEIEGKFKTTPQTTVDFGVSGKAYAQYDWNDNVLLMRKRYSNLNERLNADNETWKNRYKTSAPYLIAEDLESIIMHEFTHAWDNSTGRQLYNQLSKLDLETRNKLNGISGYASSDSFYTTRSKGSEMIAELINAKLINHPRYNALPQNVKDIIDQFFN